MANYMETLERLEALYKEQAFDQLAGMVSEFMDTDEFKNNINGDNEFRKRAYTLLAKLRVVVSDFNGLDIDVIASLRDAALLCTETVKEARNIQLELDDALEIWKKNCTKAALDTVEVSLGNEAYKEYVYLRPELIKKAIFVRLSGEYNNIVNALKEKEEAAGIYEESEDPPLEHKFTHEIELEMEYQAASNLFENAKTYLMEHRDAVSDAVMAVHTDMLMAFVNADLLAGFGRCDLKKKADVTPLDIMAAKKQAEIKDFILEAVIYPDGQVTSLLTSGDYRIEIRNELRVLYDEIATVDPDYIPLLLPPVDGIEYKKGHPGYESDRAEVIQAQNNLINRFRNLSAEENLAAAFADLKKENHITAGMHFHVASYQKPESAIAYVGKALVLSSMYGEVVKKDIELCLTKANGKEYLPEEAAKMKEFIDLPISAEHANLLLFMAESGNYDAVKLLVDFGADVNAATDKGITALWLVASAGPGASSSAKNDKIEIAKLLLENGAEVNVVSTATGVALYNANTLPEIAEAILAKYPEAEMGKSYTPPVAKSGGCYVATAVYGSYDCPEVWTLRRFRDNTLAESWYGRAFIRSYYAISPTLVKWFGSTSWFRNMWKPALDKMVENLNSKGVDNTAYDDREW